jgi:hypothetical protein
LTPFTSFEEEADAAAWLVERIAAALDEAERARQEAARALTDKSELEAGKQSRP